MSDQQLVLFGAGAIGRSFIGQLFSRASWDVVFIDINTSIIESLNNHRAYRVVIKSNGPDEILWVHNVRGVNAQNREAVVRELVNCELAATAVGIKALPAVMGLVAAGLQFRMATGRPPLDIILAENVHHAASLSRTELMRHLPTDFPLATQAGLIETSIGKMVPIMREQDLKEDPLWVFAEPYNELILDANGFHNPIPTVAGLRPVAPIQAYVDRKLYIHNLGHAAAAYLGYAADPQRVLLVDALDFPAVRTGTRAAMLQSAAALLRAYPETFTEQTLLEHIDDLLARFSNRALGDTIFRVGRDLYRKLAHEDRLIGAMCLAARFDLPFDKIAVVLKAALDFRATDEQGLAFPDDTKFVKADLPLGLHHILTRVCRLDLALPSDEKVYRICREIVER